MTTPPGDGLPPYGPPDQPPPYGPPDQPPPYGQPAAWQGGYPVPVQDHPKATTALVLGIIGLVACQVASPFAWVMGKRAVREIDASGGQLGGRGSAQAGYILGIVGTVLLSLAVLALVIGLGILLVAVGTTATTST